MLRGRRVLALWGIGVLAGAVWACETARNPGGIQRDLIPPNINLSTTKDTQQIANGLSFTVTASDNLGLKDIRLTYSGGYIALTDTVFNTAVTSLTTPVLITFPASSGAGGLIRIIGRATDGSLNFAEDTLFIFLSNVQALKVFLVAPAPGALASAGKYVPIEVVATQKGGVRRVGWTISPPTGQTARRADSIAFGAAPFPDSVDFVDSVLVTGTTGTFIVQGFAVDSGFRIGVTNQIVVTIQSAANDVTPPQVEQFVTPRAEVSDTITVHATDPSGITRIGFIVDTAGVVIGGDSINLSGTSTDVVKRFSLKLFGLTSFPVKVNVQAFAIDGAVARNRGVTAATFTIPSPTGAARTDTITIVAGVTRALPLGGGIADAIFNKNGNGGTGELYLTNPSLSRVEIFQVANTAFVKAGIPTAGPQPWGIALWPRDTLGNYEDTIIVANSGGTQLSVINVGVGGPRQLLWRQDLPDFIIETYKVLAVTGGYKVTITDYNISDRPQYLATVCRPAGGVTCSTDSVFALYSTTPEPSNPSPFTGRGTLRMEKLINPGNPPDTSKLFGHLFWEIASGVPSSTSDTLRIVLRRGLPYNQTKVVLSACAGVNVELAAFGLGDTTFVRNSGNFTHGFFGEGGNLSAAFARVMSYTTKAQLRQGATTFQTCNPAPPITESGDNDVDFGMSPAVDVSDFISNTATKVRSIATNFNGFTNAARADSIYYLDAGLRLKATSPDSGRASGMDMNYNHDFAPSGSCPPTTPSCGGTGSPNDRILFAARFDSNIDVWDTYFGQLVGTVTIRDPIIGPLRVAKDAGGNQLLFGVTAKGVVMVKLPPFTNPLPAPRR